MSFIYNMADTWNNVATTFNGIYMNISNGAGGAPVGAAASRALRLDSNGSRIFDVDISGNTTQLGNSFVINTVTIRDESGTGQISLNRQFYVEAASCQIVNRALSWVTTFGGTPDVYLYRDAANILAQRNGTSAQQFNIYNTYTDASNGEFMRIWYASNLAFIQSTAVGTGVVRALYLGTTGNVPVTFRTQNLDRWAVDGSGHFMAGTDNTYDIGASGATRPRIIYPGMVVKFASITLTSLSASIIGAASAGAGATAYISDGSVPVAFTTVAGGGTTPCPVYSDGTQWRAG